MVSSELPELLALCDRIIVLCEGRVTAELPRAEATQEKILTAAMARRTVLAPAGPAPADPDRAPADPARSAPTQGEPT
jgi:ABC-type multidrug transport system ATPase subunit